MNNKDVSFFKYLSPESAIASINAGTMRWSSPRLFNDPFDFPVYLDFAFTGEEVAEALTDEIVKMAYGPEEPIGDPNNEFIRASFLNRRIMNSPSAEKCKIL